MTHTGSVSSVDSSQASENAKKNAAPLITGKAGIVLVVFYALCMLLYFRALPGPFIFDDLHNILYNQNIQISSLSVENLLDAGFTSPTPNRPLPKISFAINYLVSKTNPAHYRLINIVIHFLTGAFLYLFLKTTLSLPVLTKKYSYGLLPAFAALIWLVHPVQTQSVSYIIQRMNTMAAMFYILALLLYVQARLAPDKKRSRILFALCIASFIFAIISKEIAITLPLIIILYEWFFFQDLSKNWIKRHLWWLAGGVALFVLLGLAYVDFSPLSWFDGAYIDREFSMGERILTEFRVLIWYLYLLVLPLPSYMNIIYDFPVSRSLFDPITTILCLVFLATILGLAVAGAKKYRLACFCILWFFINLFLESSFVGLEIIYEHRLYLPSMMLCVLPTLAVFSLFKNKGAVIAVLCCAAVVLCVFTYKRNILWGNGVALWEDNIIKNPLNGRARHNLAHTLWITGNEDRAVEIYLQAIELDRDHLESSPSLKKKRKKEIIGRMAESYSNAGSILAKKGKTSKAIQLYRKSVETDPDYALGHNNLGLTLAKAGLIDQGIVHLKNSIKADPGFSEAYANLGDALVVSKDMDGAMENYTKALAINPESPRFNDSIARILASKGRFDESINHFMKALSSNPDYPDSQQGLVGVLRLKNEVSRLLKLIAVNPEDASYCFKLANIHQANSNFDAAINFYEKSLAIKPDSPLALNELALLYMDKGRLDHAQNLFLKAIALSEKNIPALYNMTCLFASQNKAEQAVAWLKKAVGAGFSSWRLLVNDKDLINIQNTEYVRQLIREHIEQGG